MNPLPDLLPGDCLLYGPKDLFGYVTCLKTWSPDCHVEIYKGAGNSVASRNGIGVNIYPFRRAQLNRILRPKAIMDLDSAMKWFYAKAQGQAYDWLGLLCFMMAVRHGSPKKMFCSEFATRFYRQAGINPFHPSFDADKIAPGNFLMSPLFEWVWVDKG